MARAFKIDYKKVPFIIAIVLFFIPFVWFSPGTYDMGGDSTRLYFYDPSAYLYQHSLFGVSPSNIGIENIGYFNIPYILLLMVIKYVLPYPGLLVSFECGLKLSGAFVFVFLTIKELLFAIDGKSDRKNYYWTGILAGILYVFSPISNNGWDKAILTHYQIMLNPLMFYLLLRFFLSTRFYYLAIALVVSVLFSSNYSYVAAPGLFSFFPVSLVYIVLLTKLIFKKNIRWLYIFIALCLFIALHSFHLVPQIYNIFSGQGGAHAVLFSDAGKFDRGLSYFNGIVHSIRNVHNIFVLPQMTAFSRSIVLFFGIPTLIIVWAFTVNRYKAYLITGIFYTILIYLASAHITNTGLALYRYMFRISGFSMFRNFYGQWSLTFLFFFIVLASISLFILLNTYKNTKYIKYALVVYASIYILFALPFITGKNIDRKIWTTQNMGIITSFTQDYVDTLGFIKKLPSNGRVLTLPLTDPGYQIVVGSNGNAYQGPSTISYLTNKQDIAGASEFGIYYQAFRDAAKNHDYEEIRTIFKNLNITHILYNEDPLAHNDGLEIFPYESVADYLPTDRDGYQSFIKQLGAEEIYRKGFYTVYALPDQKEDVIFTTRHIDVVPESIELQDVLSEPDAVAAYIYRNKETNTYASKSLTHTSTLGENISDYNVQLDIADELVRKEYPIVVSRIPGSKYYPIVRMKEYGLANLASKRGKNFFIESLIFYASKRITELETWYASLEVDHSITAEETIVSGRVEPKLSHIIDPPQYNTWEAILGEYIYLIDRAAHAAYLLDAQESTTQHSISVQNAHKRMMRRAQFTVDTMDDDKGVRNYLSFLIGKTYFEGREHFNNNTTNVRNSHYLFKDVQGTDKERILIQKASLEPNTIEDIAITVGNVSYDSDDFIDDGPWYTLEGVFTDSKYLVDVPLVISHTGVNNLLSNNWDKVDNTYTDTINGWEPDTIYSFELPHKTHGDMYELKVIERVSHTDEVRDKDGLVESQETVVEKTIDTTYLLSEIGETYSQILKSSPDAIGAYITLRKTAMHDEKLNQPIQIENGTLNYVANPIILYQSENNSQNAIDEPSISFFKQDPATYYINVSRASDTYALIFKMAYGPHWKLSILEDARSMPERRSFLTQFFNSVFDSTQATELANHVISHGYANAWIIEANEVGNKESYILKLELDTQNYFYKAAMVSIGVFIGLIILLVLFLYKHYVSQKTR